MPNVVRSKQWYIRITAPWEHIENKVKLMREWLDFEDYMMGLHIGGKTGKPHAHIALKMKSDLQKQSLDVRIKKLFGVERSDYSSKVWDGDLKALSYMYHDPAGRVIVGFGLTEAQVNDLQRMNAVAQEIVAEAKEKASYKVVQYVLDKIKESGCKWTVYEIGWEIQKGVYSGRFHEPGDFTFERYVNEILCKQCDTEDELRDMFAARMSRLKIFSSGRI